MHKVRITAPAKINLGLEILGQREDGYHEIATVLAMVDLCDVVELTSQLDQETKRANAIDGVLEGEDLAVRALQLIRSWACADTDEEDAAIRLEKHIPIAAGLGGASSDAAATLIAGSYYWCRKFDGDRRLRAAANLGSDVPFFLGAPCALATGTGTTLEPLPAPSGWLLIVTPPLVLENKTATMYAALSAADFSDGARVADVARRLRAHEVPDSRSLHNAFARPLYELAPDLAPLPRIICDHGATFVALSGAGPSHYTWFRTAGEAQRAAKNMAGSLPKKTRMFVAPFSTLRLEDRVSASMS